MKHTFRLNAFQTLTVGLALLIFVGGVLLSLPIASKQESVPFLNALFTSASASCVTGLAVADTYSQYTFFGQLVILLLIQIGGLGFMMVSILVSFLLRRRIGLYERSILMESVGALKIGGVVRLTKHALIGTAVLESVGTLLLSTWFCPRFGFWQGLWMGLFHAVSAFCNAGFDLMGIVSPGTSFITAAGVPLVNITIMQTGKALRERILNAAHELTRMPVSNLDIRDGRLVRISDGRELMTLGALATETLYSFEHSQHLTAETTAQIKSNAYSFGCSFAEVEVDIPMCKVKLLDIVNVHDCGTLINPALAEAQVHGGMSMSIGYGLSEQLLFDEKTGKPLNNNLLDYKLSTFMDHPDLEAEFVENPEPTSPYGVKALGEPPAITGAPAIRNAILQATGVAVDQVPITPHVLFEKFKEAGLINE